MNHYGVKLKDGTERRVSGAGPLEALLCAGIDPFEVEAMYVAVVTLQGNLTLSIAEPEETP